MAPPKKKKSLSATQKREYLELCLDALAVSLPFSTGLHNTSFVHNALPEIDIGDIDLTTAFLAKSLKAPPAHLFHGWRVDLARKPADGRLMAGGPFSAGC